MALFNRVVTVGTSNTAGTVAGEQEERPERETEKEGLSALNKDRRGDDKKSGKSLQVSRLPGDGGKITFFP